MDEKKEVERFKVGDRVNIRYSGWGPGKIVEDRGLLGPGAPGSGAFVSPASRSSLSSSKSEKTSSCPSWPTNDPSGVRGDCWKWKLQPPTIEAVLVSRQRPPV
jgi:hypothetical protein